MKDNKYYYGSTTDLQRRFKEHKSGEVTATKFRRPLKLVYYEAYEYIEQVRIREKQVKSSGSIRKSLLNRIKLGP